MDTSTWTLREKSTWTPKNHLPTNEKIFNERLTLFKKWFLAWSENQRWSLLEWVLKHLSEAHLSIIHHLLMPGVIPPPPHDFTRVLPRHLCLKIFSYLDPQSLCRAAQVCWYWKYLSEAHEIWRPKCLRHGWFLPNPPSPFDHAVWKRHYVSCVSQLHWNPPKAVVSNSDQSSTEEDPVITEAEEVPSKRKVLRHRTCPKPRGPWIPPDKFPRDIHLQAQSLTLSGTTTRSKHTELSFTVSRHSPEPPPTVNNDFTDAGHTTTIQDNMHNTNPKLPDSVMLPSLLEKLRLGQQTPGYLYTESTVPLDTQATFYQLQDTSPFPQLPPYYVLPESHLVTKGSPLEEKTKVKITPCDRRMRLKQNEQSDTGQELESHPWTLPMSSEDEED